MRNIFLFSIFVLLTSNLAIAQSKQKRKLAGRLDRNFEVECLGAGSQGTQLLKVYFYFKKDKEAGIYAKQNAVIAVMFKGVFSGASGCMREPLVSLEAEEKNQKYFDDFFEPGGAYLRYVSISGDGQMTDRAKVGKVYKAAMSVSVMHAALRKRLEEDGVIRGLSSGF